MKRALILVSILLTGCAAKKPPSVTIIYFIPKECVTRVEVTGDCPVTDKGIQCPSKVIYACKRVKVVP